MSLGLGVLLCFLCVMTVSGWGSVYYVLRARKHEQQVLLSKRVLPKSWSDDDFLKCVTLFPAHALVLSVMGEVLHLSAQTQQQFGERLGAMLRHPTVQSLLDAALEERESLGDQPAFSASVTLDVPVTWTAHLAARCVTLPGIKGKYLIVVLSDRSEAQAVDRMRVDFVSHASHELRTPLASLSGFIDMLCHDETCRERHSRALSIMSQQAERMRRLIDRLLYLSRVQVRAHLRPSHYVNVDDIMALVVGEVASQFDGKKATLKVEVEEDLIIQADDDEIIQVFLNLVDNALKYAASPAGEILEIVLFGRNVTAQDPLWPGGQGIILGVRDNGCGIEPHHIPRLTERFYRVSQSQSNGVVGTGLGLSIVKHILERHGGRFRVQSATGEGTTALVWLPVPSKDVDKE